MIRRQDDGLIETALFKVKRHHGCPVFAGLKGVLSFVQSQIPLVMPLPVTTQAAGLEDWFDVLDEIDAAHLLEHDALRPLSPGGDPLLEHIGLILGQQFALGRHDLIGIGGENCGRVERAVLWFARHHDFAVFAALQQPLVGVQLKFPFRFLLPMTTQACRLEHRFDLLFKGHLGLGQGPKQSRGN